MEKAASNFGKAAPVPFKPALRALLNHLFESDPILEVAGGGSPRGSSKALRGMYTPYDAYQDSKISRSRPEDAPARTRVQATPEAAVPERQPESPVANAPTVSEPPELLKRPDPVETKQAKPTNLVERLDQDKGASPNLVEKLE